MMAITKERLFDTYVGAPRAGKSTMAAKAIKKYGQNVIVIKHMANINDETFSFLPEKSLSNWRQGVKPGGFVKCKMAFKNRKKDYQEFLKWCIDHYRNGLLVIDDTTIFERDRMSEPLAELVAMRAHLGIDILMLYHGFSLFPIDQFIFINHLLVFNTSDNPAYKKDKIPQIEKIIAAADRSRHRFHSLPGGDPRRYVPEVVTLTPATIYR